MRIGGEAASPARQSRLRTAGVEVETLASSVSGDRLDIESVLRRLGERGITRLLVEGGGEVHASFLAGRFVDRLALYVAPRIVGGREARPLVGGVGPALIGEGIRLAHVRSSRVGDGWVVEGSLSPGLEPRLAKKRRAATRRARSGVGGG